MNVYLLILVKFFIKLFQKNLIKMHTLFCVQRVGNVHFSLYGREHPGSL